MKPVREIKSATEIRQFFLNPVDGGSKVTIGGKHYYMLIVDRGFSEQGIKRRKKPQGAFKVNEKTCMTCGLTKSVDKHFYTSTNSKDGYGGMCKECVKIQGKQYAGRKKEEKLEDNKRDIQVMMYQLAKDANLIPYDLEFQEWKKQWLQKMDSLREDSGMVEISFGDLLNHLTEEE